MDGRVEDTGGRGKFRASEEAEKSQEEHALQGEIDTRRQIARAKCANAECEEIRCKRETLGQCAWFGLLQPFEEHGDMWMREKMALATGCKFKD